MKATILILLFVSACVTETDNQEPTSSTAQAVASPNAHCVLCGEDPGGGDGGGGGWLYQATATFLDTNYPGWSGSISCGPDYYPDNTPRGISCDVDFTWHSIPGYVTCEQLPGDPGDDHCGGSI